MAHGPKTHNYTYICVCHRMILYIVIVLYVHAHSLHLILVIYIWQLCKHNTLLPHRNMHIYECIAIDTVTCMSCHVLYSYIVILVFLSLFHVIQIDDSGYISLLNVNSSDVDNLPLFTPFTQQDFPLNPSNTILSGIDWSAVVAPYWYDVDTSNIASGRIYYKNVTRGTDADLIGEIDSLAAPYLCGFTSIWALIVTWDHVGHYSPLPENVSSDKHLTYNTIHGNMYIYICTSGGHYPMLVQVVYIAYTHVKLENTLKCCSLTPFAASQATLAEALSSVL